MKAILAVGTLLLSAVVLLAEETLKDELPALPQGHQWKLIWSDEFNGTKIDESKWEILGDSKRRGAFWVKEDAYLDGKGHLVLRTKKDGDRFTSGAIRTRGRFEHQGGYWVARCKLPEEQGHWPAFWIMSGQVGRVGDGGRDGTEIDIVEFPLDLSRPPAEILAAVRELARQSWGEVVRVSGSANGG